MLLFALVGRYVDDVINRIDRMFPEMSIQLSRPNGTSAMLLVSCIIEFLEFIFLTNWITVPKMQVIKDFFFSQKHIILHLSQQCIIFLALRQIGDKKNFPFKQNIYCFFNWFFVIVEVWAQTQIFTLVFGRLGNEWILIMIIKKEEMLWGRKEEGNQYDLNLFTLLLGQWVSVIWWS